MKHFKRVLCLLLAAATVFCLIGCTPNKNIENKVLTHLHEKYGDDLHFEFISLSQNKGASGRYEVDAVCTDYDTDFRIYIYSSLFITDSYSVEYVNQFMDKAIRGMLLSRDYSDSIEEIVWQNVYEDGATDYRFRTVETPNIIRVTDAKTIYRVKMKKELTLEQFISAAYYFTSDLLESGVKVEDIAFSYEYEGFTFIVQTDSDSLTENGFGKTRQILKEAIDEQLERERDLFFIDDVITVNLKNAPKAESEPIEP